MWNVIEYIMKDNIIFCTPNLFKKSMPYINLAFINTQEKLYMVYLFEKICKIIFTDDYF